jgi:DNA polymerase I-like protein with 3'-5' exonuclease and polymerase domains
MYGRLGLQCADFTDKGAPSSGKIALKRHARSNPTVARIKRIRQLEGVSKMCITLLESRKHDGLLHPVQNQTGARTGRMSMSDPNLQNVTREGTVKGFSLRSGFVPGSQWRQFHSDYKQIEMVDFADYSQDPVMGEAIRNGYDVHKATARRILRVLNHGDRDPTDEERQQAKTCNFAIIYGSGDATFADTLNLDDSIDRLFTVGEARQLRLAYLEGFPGVNILKEKVARQISLYGKITDRFGRIHRLKSSEWYKGINWLVQGGCGTLLKRAVIRMHHCAQWWNEWARAVAMSSPHWTEGVPGNIVELVLTVHDEIAFRVRRTLPDPIVYDIVTTMAAAMTADRDLYDLPLRCDVEEQSPDWGHMVKYKTPEVLPWDHPAVQAGKSNVWDASGVEKWWKSHQIAF